MTAEPLMADEDANPAPGGLAAAIREAKAGDERAFETIMLATERRVALLAWRILGDSEEVKEAVQETFLRLFRHLKRYDDAQDFFGWVFRITVNVCRDLEKRRRRHRFLFAPIETAPERAGSMRAIDDELVRRSEVDLLTRAIDALPRKERLAIILRDVEGLSTEEVAAILGSRPSTVRVQISKARVKLREWIVSRRGGSR